MAGVRDVSELSDAVLKENFDSRTIQRGLRYSAQGMARVLASSAGTLTGEVRGSGHNVYLTEVEWSEDKLGILIWSTCSCPVGDACKHAVALVATQRENSQVAPTPPGATQWRRLLAGLESGTSQSVDLVPLAIEVAATTPRRSTYSPDPTTQVTIRPMRMGARGRWVRSGITWRDISSGYGYGLDGVDPTHLSVLRALITSTEFHTYSVPAALPLSRCGAQVWQHLRRAADAGIVLVHESRSVETVAVSDRLARVDIDLIRVEDGGIRMSTAFTHENRRLTLQPGLVGLIGQPAHGLFVLEGPTLALIELDETLSIPVTRIVTGPPVVVPACDVDEFLDEYPPLLTRIAAVGSSDGSVEFTTSSFDGLVAVIDRPRVDHALLHWQVRYRRGERVSSYLLDQPVGRGRDVEAERAALGELELPVHLLDSLVGPSGRAANVSAIGMDAIKLLTEVVPWLTGRGQVGVEIRGESPELRQSLADPLISLSVLEPDESGSGRPATTHMDWFDLQVEVSVDGEQIEFVELFTALSRDDELLVLDSGTWLRLDRPEFVRLRELIEEARGLADVDPGDGTLRLNRFQTSWWGELTSLGVVARQARRWSDSVALLDTAAAPEPVDPPADLKATLRPYQQQGLDWLAFLHRHELGGILADDMGLGKTVQTLALFLHVLEQRPGARFLVVAPTSVVENWHREAQQFAPGIGVKTIRETHKRRGTELIDEIGHAEIVVTSYALFRLEFDDYESLDWEMLVLDEAQFVKNHTGKTYRCVRRLSARTKLAITGTPLENSLMDLWSLLSITAPGLYPDPKRFSEVFRGPIETGRSPELLDTLRRRIAPLMRRRTKDEVLDDLPPKIEQVLEVPMGTKHAKIYQTQLQRQRQKVLGLVDDVNKNRFEILKSLTLLRQLSLDPGLVDPLHDGVGSAKLDRLVDDLTQIVAEGHRALVFSQFTRYLARVRTRLDEVGINYSYLDGRTRRRDEAIALFKDGDVPVFVISLKAGGFGLNLTEADYCFVLDPWWNPAVETQAVDRTHRIGQRNQVMVYRYVSTGTIEEKVIELKDRKAALFTSVMDADGALSGSLSAEDIRGLFQ